MLCEDRVTRIASEERKLCLCLQMRFTGCRIYRWKPRATGIQGENLISRSRSEIVSQRSYPAFLRLPGSLVWSRLTAHRANNCAEKHELAPVRGSRLPWRQSNRGQINRVRERGSAPRRPTGFAAESSGVDNLKFPDPKGGSPPLPGRIRRHVPSVCAIPRHPALQMEHLQS